MPPSSLSARSVSAKDRSECGASIRGGSRSFYAASLLLPASVREAAHGLYAFCRLSDDAVDLGGGDADAPARLRARLANI
jgi:15-cis-phytoene synthase